MNRGYFSIRKGDGVDLHSFPCEVKLPRFAMVFSLFVAGERGPRRESLQSLIEIAALLGRRHH